MKRIIFALLILAIISCSENKGSKKVSSQMVKNESSVIKDYEKTTGGPAITFDHKDFDFGEIIDGQEVQHAFQFVNSGDEPLLILSAKGSCGCTVPEWPNEPILSGETGVILVTFNSKGRSGAQTKKLL